jgi:hypothetical protein
MRDNVEQTAATTRVRKKVSYTTKMVGVTFLGILAMSGPAAAFYDDSPILIPFLQLIQQALKEALGNSMKDGFKKMAEDQIKSQVDRYSKELAANMMPGAFCEADIVQPIVVAGVARATGYQEATNYFSVTGAGTLVDGQKSAGSLPKSPTPIIQQHNAEVRKYAQGATCKPIQAVPVDGSGTTIKCSQEERRVAAAVLLGVSPPPELPNASQSSAVGEFYEGARTTAIARKQLAALALADAGNEQKQAMLMKFRETLDKPSIEELTKLSADGGVARDSLVLQQITARLLLENYVEQLETKRLYAVYVAQRSEAEERKLLSPLRRAAAR